MSRRHLSNRILLLCIALGTALNSEFADAITVNSLAQLRSLGAGAVSNTTITLSATGGDPHPVTGITTPGEYWINGDHIADPTNTHPRFLILGGNGNTYDLSNATIRLDTRKLDGFGRGLGHDSGVDVVRIEGSNNLVQGLTLIGEDIALDTDPNAQRYADWSTVFVELSGASNTVDGAHVVARGSRTDTYGLSDAFGKGASQGMAPFIGHRKASNFRVGEATNAVVNDIHLETYSFGHNFFVQESTNTTLTNSTIKAELFPSQLVIDRPEYQQYGHTWWGEPIPDDILLAGSEGGVRVYGGASGLTVDNVVVDGARTGFATVHDGGQVNISNSYAYNTTSGFDVGDNTIITNSGGNIVNGPLLVFYGSGNNTSIDLELTEGTPIGTNWTAAYFNGNADISISSNLAAEDLPEESYVRLGQSYFENWRTFDYNTADPEDGNPTAFNDQTFANNTNQILVIGENATGNVGSSQAPVISNGKENYYDGVTLVQSGSRLAVEHSKGLGNSGTETGAEFTRGGIAYVGTVTPATMDDNGTIVENGGTLELLPGISIVDEKLTISGDGVDGNGALYSDGQTGNGTRFGDSAAGNESTIFIEGNASIGVGIAGNQMLVGNIQGSGNLTKRGSGKLSVEKDSTYSGTTTVIDGTMLVNGIHSGGGDYRVSGGTLGGDGSILSNIVVEAGGTLAPGASAGSLTAGDIEFLTGSTLEIEVAGLLAGNEYDQLLADEVILGGNLAISLLDLGGGIFMPDVSDTFTVLSGTSLSGTFDNVADGARLGTIGGEGTFRVSYDSLTDEVRLSDFLERLLGDLDGNGSINGADWTLFKAGSNTDLSGFTEEVAYQHGDLNGDFQQNLADFALFQSSYDAANGSGAFAALLSVPEPTATVLCAIASLCTASRRSRAARGDHS